MDRGLAVVGASSGARRKSRVWKPEGQQSGGGRGSCSSMAFTIFPELSEITVRMYILKSDLFFLSINYREPTYDGIIRRTVISWIYLRISSDVRSVERDVSVDYETTMVTSFISK